jgi:hypothetical protein
MGWADLRMLGVEIRSIVISLAAQYSVQLTVSMRRVFKHFL